MKNVIDEHLNLMGISMTLQSSHKNDADNKIKKTYEQLLFTLKLFYLRSKIISYIFFIYILIYIFKLCLLIKKNCNYIKRLNIIQSKRFKTTNKRKNEIIVVIMFVMAKGIITSWQRMNIKKWI